MSYNKDLRSSAIDRQRDVASKAKWQPKWAQGSPAIKLGPNNTVRPRSHLFSQKSREGDRMGKNAAMRRLSMHRKQDPTAIDIKDPDISTSDDETSQASTSPPEDEQITYSYDATRGPRRDNEVLALVVSRAVERFEDDQTTKLVKDEYEVLDDTAREKMQVAESSVFDEDFELV